MTLYPSFIRPHALILIVVFLLFLLEPVAPLSTTVFGPGSETLALVTAKMVAQAGSSKATQGVNLFAGQDEAGAKLKRTWTKLIAGQGPDGPNPLPPNLNIATSLDGEGGLGSCLEATSSLIILADAEPLAPGAAATLLSESSTPGLEKVVVVTRLGASKATGGFFLGGDAKLRECEEEIRKGAKSRGLEASVLRVGTLKGGGPGESGLGLDKFFYNTQAQLEKFMMMSGMDKFTVGCSVLPGNPLTLANPVVRKGRSISFDPYPDECSVIACASAVRHLLGRDGTVDATLSAEKGEAPPTEEEWESMFSRT
ncbi:hypothetical protein TrST_g4957 [Triparma strigata]|uniref:Uncharacterized protein n=1 Tax=Triparma strigata TaxID=1606541 RepID=A0A9W7BLF1_9STRA|nr:hypothetical protein TrST_g4957 [Triparma strigata]